MSDPFAGAFNGRTVSKLSLDYLDPNGRGAVSVSVEFTDGSTLAVVTNRAIHASVKLPRLDPSHMTFEPLTAVGTATREELISELVERYGYSRERAEARFPIAKTGER